MLTFFTIIFLIIVLLVAAYFVIKKTLSKNKKEWQEINIIDCKNKKINLEKALSLLYQIDSNNRRNSQIIVNFI